MLPKKKRKLFVLYSIPIVRRLISIYDNSRYTRCNKFSNKNLCKEKLYLVSYSIPLASMVALLLVGIIALLPSLNDESHAMDVGYEVATKNDVTQVSVDDMTDGDASGSQRAVARAVMPSTISLNITGDRNAEVETGTGVTTYRSHGVNVTVTDVQEYFLRISGATELTPPTGGTAIPGVGTTGVKGSEIPENTWGYAWTSDSGAVSDNEDMIYTSMPSSATSLSVPNLVDGNASFSGKLSFGAKFAATSVLGNYTSGVQLTLIATPKSNTSTNHGFWYNENGAPTGLDSGTASMQDAAPNFCRGNSQVGTGWTVELEDNRDGKTYTIVKLKDGNCWMQENLALEADPEKYPDGMTLAPGDTDLPADTTWVLPKSVTSWNTSNNMVAQVKTGGVSLGGWQHGYGNYYSWIAATAGTGRSVTSDGSIAVGSICPKGWKLPTGGSGGGQFRDLFGMDGNDIGSSSQIKYDVIRQAPYLFNAAGYINDSNGSLTSADTGGSYWSRTSQSSTDAYFLSFNSGNFNSGTNRSNRYSGRSVRCVQSADGGVWENNTGTGGQFSTGLDFMQNITSANFTQAYCVRSKDDLVSVGSTIQLLDSRDNKYYNIVKLADGNCWMQENLALGDATNDIILTSADSDVSSNFTLPADTNVWKMGDSSIDLAQVKVGNDELNGWQQGYGNYYSWQAATAGTGKNATADGGVAFGSICPKGWKLPTGRSGGQFWILFGKNGENLNNTTTTTTADWQARLVAVQAAPYKFPAGGIYNGSLGNVGSYGYYWSRFSYYGSNAYALVFGVDRFFSGIDSNYRYLGYSVRCIAEPAS